MGIKINRIEHYHPNKKISNNYFLEHFANQGVDISGLLEVTGRQYRYVSEDKDENSLTMAIKAARKVVKNAEIDKSQIGLIVFISTTPEYLSPTNAVKVHRALGLGKSALAYDMNCNCTGMIVGMDQVCRVMKTNDRIKYALVIGSDQLVRYSRWSEPITYSNFGESACAVLLENAKDQVSDFIDSTFYTDSSLDEYINFPPEGFSKILPSKKNFNIQDRIIEWIDFDTDDAFASAIDSIKFILSENNLTTDDVKLYCLSQFAKKNIELIRKGLGEPEEKFPFVGDEFGYTGTTSPFMALTEAIEGGSVKRGDYVILWTVGAGVVASCVLIRY